MKQIIFILFLIPSLCFAQLGINVANPKATLHIKPKGTDEPTLKIEGLDSKDNNSQDTHYKLIIDENGILKKTPFSLIDDDDEIGQESNHFYLKKVFTYDLGGINFKRFEFINHNNPQLTNDNNNIVLPEKGTYAIMFTFTGEINSTPMSIQQTLERFRFHVTKEGTIKTIYLNDLNEQDPGILDTIEITMLLSYHTTTFSGSYMLRVTNKTDEKLPIEIHLSKERMGGKNLTFHPSVNKDDTLFKTNMIMWKL